MVFYREQSKNSPGFGVLSSFDIPLLMYGAHTLGPLSGEHMGSPCDPHYVPHTFPICSTYGENFKNNQSYVAHMLSNIWGNLWATQQHMGNIWGNVVIFAFKLALLNIWAAYGEHMGKHMGNIWGTYGKHMGSTPKATPNKTSPFPC